MGQNILHITTLALQSLWAFCIKESQLLVLDDNWFVFKVEFVRYWNTREGAFCNRQKIHVEQSLLVTGFGYEQDDAWSTNIELFKEFTDVSRRVRRLGATAVDMDHVALGIVEDMAVGVFISMKELYIKQRPISTH
ncbi:hypothetical protein CsSME_00042092 [Camellia sinensis var. sinensis]